MTEAFSCCSLFFCVFLTSNCEFRALVCFVLQEVWACWCELLSYIEQENAFLDQLEEKLDKTENLPGGSDELQKVLDVSVIHV